MDFKLQSFEKPDVIISTYYEKEGIIEGFFDGKEAEMFFLPNINEGEPNKLYFGLGKEEDINANKLRNTFAKLFKRIEDLKGDNILLEKIDIKNIKL